MKLSSKTLELLKNYSTINTNYYCPGGSTIKTVSVMKNILAKAKVEEDFPEFGIYDLSEFLSVLSLYEGDAKLNFSTEYVDITWDSVPNTNIRFHFASKKILTISDKDIPESKTEVEFELTSAMLRDVIKTAAVLQVSDIVLRCNTVDVEFGVMDKALKNNNTAMTKLQGMDTSTAYEYHFKAENLKMLPADYTVKISANGAAYFKSTENEYWVALEG